MSMDWFEGKITGKSHISWENLWFPVDFPSSQPIDHGISMLIFSNLGSDVALALELPKALVTSLYKFGILVSYINPSQRACLALQRSLKSMQTIVCNISTFSAKVSP